MIRRLRTWWATRGRRARPGENTGVDDWRPGDIAECIHRGPWFDPEDNVEPGGPQYGELYRVANVELGSAGELRGIAMLRFTAFPGCKWQNTAFRKVQPRADQASAADAAFIASLKPARIRETAR